MSAQPQQLLERLLRGENLEERTASDLLRVMASGELAPPLAGALLVALRLKGETADEIRGFARAMRELARVPANSAGAVRRHRRHRRRRLGKLESVDRRFAARGRLRLARRQARQPLGIEQIGQRRRARGARAADAARRGGRRRVSRALRLHVPVRAALSPRDEAHRAGPPGARRAHRLQHLGAAREPGGAAVPRHRRLQRRDGRDAWPTRWPACR